MGFGAPSATPCLAGFFALRCFSLITIWVTPESWVVKPITSLPHWFYTRILRVPKCFSPQAFSLTPKSAHNLGSINGLECEHRRKVCSVSGDVMLSRTGDATSICAITTQHSLPFALPYPHRHCPPHGFLPHVCGERYGFTLFR